MGVSAVPGSGKTYTLSALAARLVASGVLEDDQEVLVVTLVNSAVDNFSARVASFVQRRGLLPHLGYRVRTLHGLSHDIVRERPALVGLADDFQIIDERLAEQIRQDAVDAWLRGNSHSIEDYIASNLETGRQDWVRRDQWPRLVNDMALNFIRQAKDWQVTPSELRQRLDDLPLPLPLAAMGCAIYADYQRALVYRGAVDFDDLVRLALRALQSDLDYLQRLRTRWPYILEDEAQDSSRLQENILRLLVGADGNWVRVGDPNQAIYETFTTANPLFLRRFLRDDGVQQRELPNSGRSTQSIIDLANYLIEWTRTEHPLPRVRDALDLPLIEPTPPGDPQPNPPDDPDQVRLIDRKYTPTDELRAVVDSLARWLPEHPQDTAAVLVPRNQRGFEVAAELKQRGLPYVELLRSSRATREAAGALGNVVRFLADPTPPRLATVYRVWRREDREDDESRAHLDNVARLLRRCQRVEDYVWPRAGLDWLGDPGVLDEPPAVLHQLNTFRELLRRWQAAASLPIDQLILTLAQDLFGEPADLAVAHKLALLLRRAARSHPDWRLPELTEELAVIARNERRFLGLDADDSGFDPDKYRGVVVVATVHKAKGLEWDRVYLMSVNNYDFPSAAFHDRYIAEKWFIRDGLNLEAEALAQLAALQAGDPAIYEEGEATEEARLDYTAERLRLLFVAITRARKDLIVTWNSGRHGDQQPALPLVALQTFWSSRV